MSKATLSGKTKDAQVSASSSSTITECSVNDSDDSEACGYDQERQQSTGMYEDLWERMSPVGEGRVVRKLLVTPGEGARVRADSCVKVNCCGYLEGEREPFDSVYESEPLFMQLGTSAYLEGLEIAVKSMRIGEYSQFLLRHPVMYGELGCPPRIPPAATCFFHIMAIAEMPQRDLCLRTDVRGKEEESPFQTYYEKAASQYKSGKFYFQKSEYNYAAKAFQKAVNVLHSMGLANESEEQKVNKFLLRLYMNLAICYNMLKLPKKACIACNEIKRMGKYRNNSKVLYQNGRALLMLGEFGAAEDCLCAALRLQPDSKEIHAELTLLREKENTYVTHENAITEILEASLQADTKDTVSDDFVKSLNDLCFTIKEDDHVLGFKLPTKLSDAEMDAVKSVTKKCNLKIQNDGNVIVIRKDSPDSLS